jgi:TPR repeat protein
VTQAMRWYPTAAAHNDPWRFGYASAGFRVENNEAEAVRWYRKGRAGLPRAQVAVGHGYVNGLGVARTCGRRARRTKNCECLLKSGSTYAL